MRLILLLQNYNIELSVVFYFIWLKTQNSLCGNLFLHYYVYMHPPNVEMLQYLTDKPWGFFNSFQPENLEINPFTIFSEKLAPRPCLIMKLITCQRYQYATLAGDVLSRLHNATKVSGCLLQLSSLWRVIRCTLNLTGECCFLVQNNKELAVEGLSGIRVILFRICTKP